MSNDPQQQPGQDSRVEDWFGQSVQRDEELVEELTDGDIDEKQAEREFAARATGEAEQERRHGDTIDPDQGQSAYQNVAKPDDDRSSDDRSNSAADNDPDSPGETIDDAQPAEPNEPG